MAIDYEDGAGGWGLGLRQLEQSCLIWFEAHLWSCVVVPTGGDSVDSPLSLYGHT